MLEVRDITRSMSILWTSKSVKNCCRNAQTNAKHVQVISRTGGSRGVLPYESAGLKDIVLLEPGETVDIEAHYGP